jgi:hypothetical protein
MIDLIYVIAGSPEVEPLKGKYRMDYLLDKCVKIAAQCNLHTNPLLVATVFLSRYGSGLLTYSDDAIAMFVRMSAEETLGPSYLQYAQEIDLAIARHKEPADTNIKLDGNEAISIESQTLPQKELSGQALNTGITEETIDSQDTRPLDPLALITTASLGISSALRKSLTTAGLNTAREILEYQSRAGLASLDGIGPTSQQQILDAISKLVQSTLADEPQEQTLQEN